MRAAFVRLLVLLAASSPAVAAEPAAGAPTPSAFVPSTSGEPPRVARARARASAGIQDAFRRADVAWPPDELLLRVFKEEAVLEVWASARGQRMVKVREYPVCASSGGLGPKRAQGDLQVPEGFYRVDRFNPWSAFHLSLGIDYPNLSDRLRSGAADPGGDIFLHGGCATVGCVPITDEAIEELFVIATDVRTKPVQVHLLPRRMTAEAVQQLAANQPEHAELWQELAAGYEAFERTRRPPRIRVEPRTGRYRVRASTAVPTQLTAW